MLALVDLGVQTKSLINQDIVIKIKNCSDFRIPERQYVRMLFFEMKVKKLARKAGQLKTPFIVWK